MKKYDAARTKASLLEAGLIIFEEIGMGQMRIDDIVKKAGVAKGTFYIYFRDRADFLLAIHRSFHDDLRDKILTATLKIPSGKMRLLTGVEIYLDCCLAGHGIKAMLFEARSEPVLREEVLERNKNFSKIIAEDFTAMQWTNATEAATLFVALVAEGALQEMQSGKKLIRLRQAITQFVAGTRP